MDFEKQLVNTLFDSELGQELIHLHSISSIQSLDPSSVKEIITLAEDTRISTSLSEVGQQIVDRELLHRRAFQIENTRLNLRSGQQCVRDFFICLNENLVNWPDVFSFFSFNLKFTIQCLSCEIFNEYETTQTYIEISVPPSGSNLSRHLEDYFNAESEIQCRCDDQCKATTNKIKRTTLSVKECEAKFLIIVLSRCVQIDGGFRFLKNSVNSTENIYLR